MRPQIHTDLCLPSYLSVNMYPEGFAVKVTRQIPNNDEAFEYFKTLPKSPDSDATEVYYYKGRNYITCRTFFRWDGGFYPNHSKVLYAANEMHKYIMYHITNYKIKQLEARLELYSEF